MGCNEMYPPWPGSWEGQTPIGPFEITAEADTAVDVELPPE